VNAVPAETADITYIKLTEIYNAVYIFVRFVRGGNSDVTVI